MPRKVPSGLTRYFRDFIRRTFSGQEPRISRNTGRRLRLEQLEGRRLLASDLGVITGIVTHDTPVVGATINLYRDLDTDGIFEPGGMGEASYAKACYATYWRLDVDRRRLEVREGPSADGEYKSTRILNADEAVSLPVCGVTLQVRELLPS